MSGAPLDPSHDLKAIHQRLESVTGARPDLPDYVRTPGVHWSIVVVACASCTLTYTQARCHSVDLVIAPDFRQALMSGGLGEVGCPGCGEVCARPIGVFVEDPPLAGDPLASLSCTWRVSPDFLVYQPPPGSERQSEIDRILEVRFSLRLEDLGWTDDPNDGTAGDGEASPSAHVRSLAVAYTWDELRHLLSGSDKQEGVPQAMAVAIRELAHKIRSGVLPLHQAEQQISRSYSALGKEWPLIAPPPPQVGEQLLEGAVQAIMAEAIAAGQNVDPSARVVLATLTMSYHLAMNEPAAAERAFARAEDLLSQVPADNPRRPLAEAALRTADADLSDVLGHHERAQELRSQPLPPELIQEGSLAQRIVAVQSRERAALALFQQGRLADALIAYPECIVELRAMKAEAEGASEEQSAEWAGSVRHNLNAAQANYAAVLTDIAEHLEAATDYHAGRLPHDIGRALGVDVRQSLRHLELLRRPLRQQFPDGFDADVLRRNATELLIGALEGAENAHYWDYAAVQAHRLASLARQRGEIDEAAGFAERAIGHAKRCGDHERAGTAGAFLAERCLDQADGGGALARLEDAVLEWMRGTIGRGAHVTADPAVASLDAGIVRAVSLGADPTRGALLLETLKATTTASALATGIPVRPTSGVETELSRQVADAHRLREELRFQAIWSPDDPELRQRLHDADLQLTTLRTQLSLRNPQYAEWVDASNVELSDPDRFRHKLAGIGASTRMLGCFSTHDAFHTYVIGPASTTFFEHAPLDMHGADLLGAQSLERLSELLFAALVGLGGRTSVGAARMGGGPPPIG